MSAPAESPKRSKTWRACTICWRAASMSDYVTTVPAGHPVTAATCPTVAGGVIWFAEPAGLGIEGRAMEWHDAVHYGIPVPREAVLGAICEHEHLARQCPTCDEVREALG